MSIGQAGAFFTLRVSLLAGAAIVGVSPALAQGTEAQTSASAARVALPTSQVDGASDEPAGLGGDIVVTGSLVAKSGFDMPTPVTVVNEADLARIGAQDISEVVNQIPSVRASLTSDSTANQSSLAGGTYPDLRGLGYLRTLILVDGRRYSPTNGGGGVNTSALPQVLIKGVDVVTGGASAAYGSDAVAGVINFKMDDQLQGIKGKVQGGLTDYGDYRSYLASLAYGTSFFDGRARLTVAGEISENSGIQFVGDRPWGDNVSRISNPAYTATNDEPRQLLVSNAKFANITRGGIITSPTVLRGIHFLPDGSAVPFNYGTLVTNSTMVGGDGADRTAKSSSSLPLKRQSLFGRLTVDATDSLTLFAEVNYSRYDSEFLNVPGTETITILRDNPYVPQSIRDVMVARNIPSFVMGRTFDDNRRETRDLNVETRRILAGAEGKIGDWNWDAYYSGGWTDNESQRLNSRVSAKFALAIDAVINPANGAVVCRSTLTNPTNGCVPINLIGEGRASEEALRYTNGDGVHNQHIAQHVIAAKVRGEPFSTWAGPVGLAVGVERRWWSVDQTTDPLSEAFAFTAGGIAAYTGEVNVKEAFGELLVPLARDEKWAQNLSLNLAGRVTDYSTSGTVYTWKVGANYAADDTVRFRATRSRDIRAPSLGELYAKGSTSSFTVTDLLLGQTYSSQSRNTGNPFLTPEIANTLTAGAVFSPSFIPRLQLSVDYFDIKLKDAIVSLGAAVTAEQCYTTSPHLCSLITRGPNPGDRITSVINGPANFERFSIRGIDFELSYRHPLWGGQLDLRALATFVDQALITDPFGVRELHDSVEQGTPSDPGGQPRWRGNTRLSYSNRGRTISIAARYVGGGRIDPTFTYKDLDVLRVSGRMYFDASVQHPLIREKGESVVLFANVRNMFNNAPPATGQGVYGTTRSLYDVVGRVYNAGVRFRF